MTNSQMEGVRLLLGGGIINTWWDLRYTQKIHISLLLLSISDPNPNPNPNPTVVTRTTVVTAANTTAYTFRSDEGIQTQARTQTNNIPNLG